MLREKIRIFRALGHEVRIHAFSTAERGMFAVDGPVEMEALDFSGPGRFRRYREASRRMAAKIEAGTPDLIWVEKCRFTGSPPLLRYLRRPAVFYMQEPLRIRAYEALAGESAPKTGPPPLFQALKKLPRIFAHRAVKTEDRKSARAAAKVYANSLFSARWIERVYGFSPKPLYQGVDVSFFTPLETAPENFVLSVGRLDETKGHDFLVDALSRIPAAARPELRIAFDDERAGERARLEARARSAGVGVVFLHRVTDVDLRGLYRAARAVLCAAKNEPFGLVPLEAMACGAPVIAVNEGGFVETVTHDRTGFLLPREAAVWADKIVSLASDLSLRAHLGRAGRETVESVWSLEALKTRLHEALQARQ